MTTEKPQRKYDRGPRYEARKGTDPEYPIDVYIIVGQTQDEYYENSFVSLEAAREDYPGIELVRDDGDEPKFLAPETCPICGNKEDIEEGDGRHFGGEERRSFHCSRCDTYWYQWEWVENTPYAIEIDDARYDLPPQEAAPVAGPVTLREPLKEAAQAALDLLHRPWAEERLLDVESREEETEVFAVRGMLGHALGNESGARPRRPRTSRFVRQKQALAGMLADMASDDIACVLADYISCQDEDVQAKVAEALVDACVESVREDIGESHFNVDREKC